jgi:hypothetical protein
MAYNKIQKQSNDKMMGTGGLTGNAEGGGNSATQPVNQSTAGNSGGFTNIQDYMNANKGNQTNQNYLNNKADTQISNQANLLNTNVGSLSAINQNPAASQQGVQDLLGKNNYETARNYATNPNFKATAEELPDMYSGAYNPTSKLTGNLSSVMDYIGEIKPPSQQYTPGMQKFDEMILGGDKDFAKNFATNKQQRYKSQVEDPYGAATAARETQKGQAKQNVEDWRTQFKTYLGGEDKKIQDILAKQQAKEKNEATITPEEYFKLAGTPYTAPAATANNGAGNNLTKAQNDAIIKEQMDMYMKNLTRTGNNAPSLGTATGEYGQNADQLMDYNKIAEILGLTQLTPSTTYNPGQWSYTPKANPTHSTNVMLQNYR